MLTNMLHFTHLAVCEDGLRLIQHVPEICSAFKDVATHNLEDAQLGAVMWAKDQWNRRLLYLARAGWDGRTPTDGVEAILARSLGAITRRACDKQLSLTGQADPKAAMAYRDATVMREVYGETFQALGYEPLAFGGKTNLEEHLRVLTERAMLAQHTHIPDLQEPEAWLEKMLALRSELRSAAALYAQAYEHPDPELMRRYITEPNFYAASDDLIGLARAIQNGESVGQDAVTNALDAGTNESQYAQALARGLRYLRAASSYFLGRMQMAELKEAWEATEERWPEIWDGGKVLVGL